MAIPKITKLKELIRQAVKIQAYCSKPGYEKIRNELDKKYGLAKFEKLYENSKVIGFVVDPKELKNFKQNLDDGLYDLLNPEFADTLPELLAGGKLNIPKMFDQEPFASLIKGLPKDLGIIIKKISLNNSKKLDKNIQEMIAGSALTSESNVSANKITPEMRARIQDAKDNLMNHGFELDEKNGIIMDPDGYEISNVAHDTDGFVDAVVDLSKLIDNQGYDKAMDRIRAYIRKKLAEEELEGNE